MKIKIGKLGEVNLLRDLDRTLAIAGVIFSVLLIIYLNQEFGRLIYLLTGILSLISCLLWLGIRKGHPLEFQLPESGTLFKIFAISFFILYSLSILSVFYRPDFYERPLIYFILTSVMAGLIACETFISGRRHIGLILIQIVLVGISVAWSQLLIFPSIVGVDPWFHQDFTNQILETFYIPEGDAYSRLPIFHLIIAASSLLTTLPYKFATMISVSLGQILTNGIFIFLIATSLFKNHRIGLLASLLVTIADNCIFMSYWSIPNSFIAVFIPIAFYILMFKMKDESRIFFTILVTLLMITIVLGHTIVAMCMAILLFVGWCSLRVYQIYYSKIAEDISLIFPVSFTMMMFAWWTYASGSIETLGDLIKFGFSIDYFETTPAEFEKYIINVPLNEQVFNNLGMFLFFTISFIGIFYMISRKGNSSTFTFAWIGMIPLAISFFSIISGHSVIQGRWWYFAQLFLCIPLAVGLVALVTWKCKRYISILAFIFVIVVPLCFFNIMSPVADVDNHFFSPESTMTHAFTSSEMQSISTIFTIRTNEIMTDEYSAGSQKFIYDDVFSFNEQISFHRFDELHGTTVLLRKNILYKPFKLYTTTYKLDYNPVSDSRMPISLKFLTVIQYMRTYKPCYLPVENLFTGKISSHSNPPMDRVQDKKKFLNTLERILNYIFLWLYYFRIYAFELIYNMFPFISLNFYAIIF